MGWARIDDRWHDHPKVIAAGLEAAGLWAMCLTWAHQARRTARRPGVVPQDVISRFAGLTKGKRLAGRLRDAGLFDEYTDAGWPIHDFHEYLPKYDPEQASKAGRKGAANRWGNSESPNGLPPEPPYDPEGEPSC